MTKNRWRRKMKARQEGGLNEGKTNFRKGKLGLKTRTKTRMKMEKSK